MHLLSLLLLADSGDSWLRVRRQDIRLRVDNAQWTEDKRLVLRRRYRRDRRVPRERRYTHKQSSNTPIIHTHTYKHTTLTTRLSHTNHVYLNTNNLMRKRNLLYKTNR